MPDYTQHYNDYEQLLIMLKESGKDYDMELIDKAYNIALEAHKDQKRKSGIPYILHPTSVACILAELGMDSDSIVAALLHDVVEDTPVTIEKIKKKFGKTIANLIDGVTKLGKIPYSSREEEQAENIRKMLMAMANDIRVIIIKLADRLNNMRTIDCMSDQKRRDKALESMEVYAPIAHRLGIRAVKEELEDLSLRQLDPIAYGEIEKALELKSSDRKKFIDMIKQKIRDRVSDIIPDVYIEGRVKSINGIYRKVFVQGRSMDEIYDVYAVRVIVNTVNDCYNVLGIVHDMFRPIPNRFKDYISTPKPNLYQSLHTTVVGKEALPFEIQIRTWEMHHNAEYGIAAHWKYKLGISENNNFDKRVSWIREMLENQKDDGNAIDLVQNIKSDLAPEEVYVLTPKGDILSLPIGSTVIDFAYAIHSEVGNHMIGAKIDKRIVPIDTQVKTGEIIEIITTKESSHGPSRDWLKIVKTSEARNKIRQWFKKEKLEENIIEGKAEVEKEFKRNNIILTEKEMKKLFKDILNKYHYNSMDSFYAAIGYGGIHLPSIMPKIKEEYLKINKNAKDLEEETNEIKYNEHIKLSNIKADSGVLIDGIDNCLIKFAKCCNPLPGDEIIGFITRGYGVSIHKRNCKNVPDSLEEDDNSKRWLNAYWTGKNKEQFNSILEIFSNNRYGLLADVTSQISSMQISINSLNTKIEDKGYAIIYLNIVVNGLDHLNTVTSKLSKIKGVVSIKRA